MSAKIGTVANENNMDAIQVYTSARGIELYGSGNRGTTVNATPIANLSLAQAESFAAMLLSGVRAIRENRKNRNAGPDDPYQ